MPFPVYLRVILTHRCVNSCVFCSGDFLEDKGDINPDVLARKMAVFAAAGGEMASFSGGEPMLYAKIGEAASFAKSLGLKTRMTTNFLLFRPETARDIDCFHISVHSLDPDIYRKISKPAVSYDPRRFMAGIWFLRQSGKEIRINSVYRPEWEESLLELLDFFERREIGVNVMNDMLDDGKYMSKYREFCEKRLSGKPFVSFRKETNPGWQFCRSCRYGDNCASTRAVWLFPDGKASPCPRRKLGGGDFREALGLLGL